MLKYFIVTGFCLFSNIFNSNENLLTIQQQVDRLQREVIDLSQAVFSNQQQSNSNENNNDNNMITNLSAIDMRIYDIEKDLKNLTANIEDIFFQLEDLSLKINNFEDIISSLEEKIIKFKEINTNENLKTIPEENKKNEDNTLGSLKISSDNNEMGNLDSKKNTLINENEEKKTLDIDMTPEDQFQLAFDNIRNKNWDDAKNAFLSFIENNPESQLSGSAHYWLGELYILEKNYRDAALIFADGYQKFPESIKAPDMLFKLSQSLFEINKISESCKTLEKIILDYPKNKLIKNTKKQIQNYGCLDASE